jgi:hypothetical protein
VRHETGDDDVVPRGFAKDRVKVGSGEGIGQAFLDHRLASAGRQGETWTRESNKR